MFTTYPHSQYYRDRTSERELCCDFPGDELFIRGLRAMELHLARYNGYVHIPVVRVMNTVHRAICILLHGNSGYEQADYDQAIHQALGQERLLTGIAMVTLIAILRRTDGQRARQCRSMLMDDRSEDFYEGLELYERLIGPTELRLNEEDFLTDIMRQITDLQNTVQQLTQERQQLKQQIQTMNQYNQYNAPIYNYNAPVSITNNYYTQPPTATLQAEPTKHVATVEPEDAPQAEYFCRITEAAISAGKAQQIDNELRSAAVSAPKLIKAIRTNEALGYLDTKNLSSTELYNLLNEHYELPFKYRQFAQERNK